jgi:protein gp37
MERNVALMNKTSIPWADYTWSPITGCTKGCDYCYARKLAARFPKAFPNGFKPTFHPDRLDEPAKVKKPSIIFVGSMGDIFDNEFSILQISDIFKVMRVVTQHTFMILTKQPRNMELFVRELNSWALTIQPNLMPNIWFGVTLDCYMKPKEQKEFLEPLLRFKQQGYETFLSIEPMLGFIRHDLILELKPGLVIIGSKTPGEPLHRAHKLALDRVIIECEAESIPLHYKHGRENPKYNGRVYNALVDGRMGK